MPPALQVYLLGVVDFEAALQFQRRLHYDITGNRSQAALIICEHPPLITVGRQGSRAHILFEPAELQYRNWPVRWVNRAGGCMLHLPGQLAIYPILPLDSWKLTISAYLERLSSVLTDSLGDFSLRNITQKYSTGLWSQHRMIGSIGVAVRDWVSYFGAYLNINPDLEFFRRVRCDYHNHEPMTSLERERKGPVRSALVRERIVDHFQQRFPVERVSLFFDHPSLKDRQDRCREEAYTPS